MRVGCWSYQTLNDFEITAQRFCAASIQFPKVLVKTDNDWVPVVSFIKFG